MRRFVWLLVVFALGGLVAHGCSLNPQPAPPVSDGEHAGGPAVSGSSDGATSSNTSSGASTTGGLNAGSGGGGSDPSEGAAGMAGAGGAPEGQ